MDLGHPFGNEFARAFTGASTDDVTYRWERAADEIRVRITEGTDIATPLKKSGGS